MTVLDRPEPPRNIHGSEFAGEALTLNWSAPFEDGGAPITNYVIERFVNNHNFVTYSQSSNVKRTFLF